MTLRTTGTPEPLLQRLRRVTSRRDRATRTSTPTWLGEDHDLDRRGLLALELEHGREVGELLAVRDNGSPTALPERSGSSESAKSSGVTIAPATIVASLCSSTIGSIVACSS